MLIITPPPVFTLQAVHFRREYYVNEIANTKQKAFFNNNVNIKAQGT